MNLSFLDTTQTKEARALREGLLSWFTKPDIVLPSVDPRWTVLELIQAILPRVVRECCSFACGDAAHQGPKCEEGEVPRDPLI